MPPNEDTTSDSAPGVVQPLWGVTEVEALDDFRLRVRFEDGLQGEVWMRRLLEGEVEGTVFAALRDPSNFADVLIDSGAVVWKTGADLAPDAMYAEIRAHGHWDVDP
jgi:hypothetical protein